MGIRAKIAAILGLIILLLVTSLYFIVSKTVVQGFLNIEADHVRENVIRVENAIGSRVDEINTKLSDWSQWDDTYAFIEDRNPEYVTSNLNQQAPELLKVDVMLFFDNGNELIVGKRLENGLLAGNPFPDGLDAVLRDHPTLLGFAREDESHEGVVMLPAGPFLFATRPIVTSDGSGPIRGTILFGKYLDDVEVSRLSDLTHLDIVIHHIGDDGLSPLKRSVESALLDGEDIVTHAQGEKIGGHALIRDVFGEPGFIIEAVMSRDILQVGLRSVYFFALFGGVIAVLFGITVLVLLERIVLSKIVKLHEAVETLRRKGVSAVREIALPGKDELSSLAKAINGLLGTVRVSEDNLRRQAEELRKFELAVEYNFDHIIITDPDGKVLYANPAVKRVTGFSTEEIIGKTPALWGGQMGKDFYERFWKTIKEDREPFVGELTNRKKTGERYLAEARVIPILDDEKRHIRFFVGLERDITAQRDYERNLLMRNQLIAEEKERSEGILRFLRSIGDGIFAVDRDRRVIFMNDAAERLTKKTFDEVKGREPRETLPFYLDADPPTQCPCPLETVIEGGQELSFPHNLFLWGDEGKKVHVSGRASPIRDKNGTIAGCIVVFRDVTEKRELERMKDRFLSVAAHQLRTPLGSMRWNMEMLFSGDYGKLPKDAKDAVGDLYENSQRLVTIVNDLLDVSRIDQHRAAEKPEKTDILAIVRNAAKTLSPDADSRNVSVVLPSQESFPSVMVSPKHFYEVVENLLSNAIKYNRPGGEVRIFLEHADGMVRMRIADTGIGIPEADREKIFEKFFRAENAVLAETDGSGLGLSVVQSFVEEDGGTVRFESEKGVGTTFIVEYPIARSVADEGDDCLIPLKNSKKKIT